jgi:hypothetical protein
MKKILLFACFAMLAHAGQAQGTAPTASMDAPLTLQEDVSARVNRHFSHYEIMSDMNVLDTSGNEYSMLSVTQLVATQVAMEYLAHSQEASELLNPADAGKAQGQPSGWSVLFLMVVGLGLGVALTLSAFGHLLD